MGGHAAAVRVYRLDGTLVGDFDQSRFYDREFPYLSKGGSWCDMATYFLDLTPNIGEVLYIELCDVPIQGGWANAFFDDVVTYYPYKPAETGQWVNDGHQPGKAGNPRQVWIPSVEGVNNLYTPRNAGFETGDLTGWTVKNPSHFRKSTAVISAMDYDMEYKLNGADRPARLPYNQVGNYHLSGRDVNLSEDATWELCSSPFTLAGSGYISVKMGGSSAAFRVRTVENNLVVAYCKQLRYNDINFPYLSKGGSWWDMATYVMDLSPFLGQKMVIELLDEEVDAAWAHAFFDDIVTLYPKRPTTLSDTVIDGYDLWSDETKEINIPWIYLDVYGDVIGRFPPGPSTMKDISGEVGPQSSIDLYEYFRAKQGMSASELKKSKLVFTSVRHYDNDGGSWVFSENFKNLPADEGAYVVEYEFVRWGRKQAGRFYILVLPSAPEKQEKNAPEGAQIPNGDFETGSLNGWEPLTPGFNADTAVISARTYWEQYMPYNQAGEYHLSGFPEHSGINEADSWAIRSSTFTLQGSGYISVRMGGRAAAVKVFTADGTLVDYYKQTRFKDTDFPNAALGSWADMGTYVMDLSAYLGQELYIELHDEQISGGWANAFFDEIVTYYRNAPDWEHKSDYVLNSTKDGNVLQPAVVSIPWRLAVNRIIEFNPEDRQIINGGFETGDLFGWTVLTDGFNADTAVISAQTYWGENLPYNQAGDFHLDGWNTGIDEAGSWSVRSSTFTLAGSGYISVRMGGHAAAVKVFTADGTLVGYYRQTRFNDNSFPNVEVGSWADMGTYVMDLSAYLGQELYIELHDEPVDGWAHAFFDEVVTYYETAPDWEHMSDTVANSAGASPSTVHIPWQLAENLDENAVLERSIPENAQIPNGGFETGGLEGWEVLTDELDADIAVISAQSSRSASLPSNWEGDYYLDGQNTGSVEGSSWAVRSKTFTMQGSGYISVCMGGSAAVKVYTADGALVGRYTPAPDSWNDMCAYVMDLSDYLGEDLYIELCGESIDDGQAHAFFDEAVTYYETAYDWET